MLETLQKTDAELTDATTRLLHLSLERRGRFLQPVKKRWLHPSTLALGLYLSNSA